MQAPSTAVRITGKLYDDLHSYDWTSCNNSVLSRRQDRLFAGIANPLKWHHGVALWNPSKYIIVFKSVIEN